MKALKRGDRGGIAPARRHLSVNDLHVGDRVSVAIPSKPFGGTTVRCHVELSRDGYSADRWPILLMPETEGVKWSRGWYTKAAQALLVAVALS